MCRCVLHLDRVGQGDGDSQRKSLRHSDHQHGDTDDEELDEELDVDGETLVGPGQALHPEGVDEEEGDEDDDGDP